MRKITIAILILSFGLWFGCSDDDNGPTGPDGPTIVTAATGSTAPARLSVEDTVWNRITSTSVSITADRFSSARKSRPTSLLAVAGSVAVQAVVVSDVLYLRLAWDDDTWDRWPGRFEVTSFDTLPPDTLPHFTSDALSSREDQVMVLFKASGETSWDVWNWRMTTTGAAYLAEGATLTGTNLATDAGNVSVVMSNVDTITLQPLYMHPNGPASQDFRLVQSTAVDIDYYLPWDLGDLLAGWVIDDTLYLPQNAAARGSRFDIGAYARHSSGEYVVVLHRELNTGNNGDQDLSGPATLDVRIGITNNTDFSMIGGDSRQGFTSTFKLNIP